MKINKIGDEHLEFTEKMFSDTLSMIYKENGIYGLCELAHIGTRH